MQSNNDIILPGLTNKITPPDPVNSDSAIDVQRTALGFFKVSTFTSYTELRPTSAAVLLVKSDTVEGEDMRRNMLTTAVYSKARGR